MLCKLMFTVITEENLPAACRQVSALDERLALVFRTCGLPPLWKRAESFATLVHIILEQQVSLASALAAFEKLKARTGRAVTPEAVLALSDAELKAAYFSRQKTVYVRELARAVTEKRLNLDELSVVSDEAVKNELKKIKGIGDWTADIYLLMAMGRPDVMPRGDLALHAAWHHLSGSERRPTSEEFVRLAEKWTPLRSVAARLLWHFYLSRRAAASPPAHR